ncbi:MAG: hypothetical protein RBS68_14105 [Anaerolineales bacterium]|jgi:hypothetical protein|nr:hypothetical protein [Anaerolineales bacterium]
MMLTNVASQLNISTAKRHLFFLAATLATVLFIGYNFGTFDEAMHIPFLKAVAYPSMYDGDAMIGLHNIYYSYFWHFFVPVLQAGWLEPALFALHLATIYLSFWAIWALSETLFHNPLASFLSVIGFIVPHFGFSGFPIFEFSPLSRTFVLPFLLIALNQFLKGRIPLAFLIAGLMYNIHVVSVNFVLAMFGLACLLEFRRIGIKKILIAAVLFLATAAPVLLWKAGAGGDPIDFSLRPEWVDFLNQTLFFHLFAMFSPRYPGTWPIILGGVSTIFIFFAALPQAELSGPVRTARIFLYAGMIVVLTHVIAVNFLPVTILIQSQIIRIGLWILILAYLFFANFLARVYQQKKYSGRVFAFLSGAFIFSPTPILALAAWAWVRWIRKPILLKIGIAIMPALVIAACAIVWVLGFWNPGGLYLYGQPTAWVDVQRNARDITPPDARFITPPEKWGPQESDWRVHAERASAGTLSEILVAAFQPGYETEWKTRFELIAPGALAQFDGDYFNNIAQTRAAYYSLTTQDLLRVACILDAQYAVIEKPHSHPLPVAYENSEYWLYNVSGFDCP